VIHLVGDHVRQAEIVVVTGHDEGRYRSDAGYVPKRAPSWAICDLIGHLGIARVAAAGPFRDVASPPKVVE
jgi:hypothetical protein